MTDGRIYRFETAKQLGLCLGKALSEKLVLSAQNGTEIARVPLGATAFAVSSEMEVAWIDSAGAVRRDTLCAGPMTGNATRMLFQGRRIWVLSGQSLQCLDSQSLELVGASEWRGAADIAGDGADGVWLLSDERVRRVDCDGRGGGELDGELDGDSIAGVVTTVAVFSKAANQVILVDGKSNLTISLQKILGDDLPEFTGERISSSGSVFLIEGSWDSSPGVLLLDRDGNPAGWGSWEDGAPPLHVLAAGHDLVIVVRDGGELNLLRLKGAADAGGRLLLTPVLQSDTRPGDWLRANVRAILPEGATLSLRWAATKDDWRARIASDVARDSTKPVSARVKELQDQLDWNAAKRTYVGRRTDAADQPRDFAFPLHEADGPFLWLELTMHHGKDTAPPQLVSLVVHHDSPTLMDRLPAVYRTPDGDDGLLRRLVSVLETTTQDLDEEIGKLADRLDPGRTGKRWLAGLARLLGLPFDDSLGEDQQRRLLRSAVPILAGRGTRNGIIALLQALFSGGQWRVIDRTEQLAAITIGGGATTGSPLPAFLSGASERVPKLNARLILGRTGLCATDACDELSVKRAPELLVEIAASPRDQRRYGSAVRQMIESMLPAGVRLRLRWMSPGSGSGETLTVLREPRPLVLGNHVPVEGVRLHGDRSPRLRNELRMGHRLQ